MKNAWLPSAITFLRLLLIPFIIYYGNHQKWMMCLLFFLLAAFSDFLDGFLARRLHQETNFGKIFDPFADKIFLIVVFAALYFWHLIPFWIVFYAFLRDLFLIIGALFLKFQNKKPMSPSFFGKMSTVFQMSFCFMCFVNAHMACDFCLLLQRLFFISFLLLSAISTLGYIFYAFHQK